MKKLLLIIVLIAVLIIVTATAADTTGHSVDAQTRQQSIQTMLGNVTGSHTVDVFVQTHGQGPNFTGTGRIDTQTATPVNPVAPVNPGHPDHGLARGGSLSA